jgi:hypothetical protein
VLRTLADVRARVMKLPEERRQWSAVQHIAGLLLKAANGEDVGDITVPLRISRHALRCE